MLRQAQHARNFVNRFKLSPFVLSPSKDSESFSTDNTRTNLDSFFGRPRRSCDGRLGCGIGILKGVSCSDRLDDRRTLDSKADEE
jgi:hypothetical protein